MKLYIIPGACSLAVNIALREAQIPFEIARVDLQTGTADDGSDFRKVNPKGYVPALRLENGQVLTETIAVLEYVADRNPTVKLAPPPGTMERYRLMEWLSFINSEMHKGFFPLFSEQATDEVKLFARNHLLRRLDYLQAVMSDKYLVGGHFSIADAYLFTVLGWGDEVGLGMGRWPRLRQYRVALAARPHLKAALESEG